MTSLNPQTYRALLRVALRTPDADTIKPDPHSLFTPRGHRLALDPDVTVVKGGRGVGKTVWFQALQDPALRAVVADEYQLPVLTRVEAHTGFGSERKASYPSPRTLEDLLRTFSAQDIWYTVVLAALEVPELQSGEWSNRIRWVLANPEAADNALINADREAEANGTVQLFLFDALEWLHRNRSLADRLATGILQLALELRVSTRRLRAKVFVRHDMLENLTLSFPDASKLMSNAAELIWSRANLYGLLFHHLGNSEANAQSTAFRETTGLWKEAGSRHIPPDALVGDGDRQKAEFVKIAGPYMGKNHRKGHTYTWLPNHLADGTGQVSPRSFLSALRTAAQITEEQNAGHDHALHWDAIKRGVQVASKTRVDEITEDIPWVATSIAPLKEMQVPIEQQEVESCWRDADLKTQLDALQLASDQAPAATGPRDTQLSALIAELIELGVMTSRRNGKLDLPDIYRIAFGLGRKGGVPRVRSS
ncbi:hypothetical protein ACWEV3_29615 [Saccharopolyspora sp. NPDC003752]